MLADRFPITPGYVDTGFACNRGRNAKTLIVTALLCLRVATLRVRTRDRARPR
jgi:hypothetical protein